MVLCIIALPLFALLGIFSVKYRKLTLDSLDCIFRTVTLRKCHSGLDKRIKAHITGTALKYSPPLAKFVQKFYPVISWVFIILFFWSLIVSTIGVYNYVQYGNCNGPESTGFCVFDPTGQNSGMSEAEVDSITGVDLQYPAPDGTDPIRGNADAQLTIVEFGCYTCPYTKKAEPILDEVLAAYEGKVNLQFRSFIIPNHALSQESAVAAECAFRQSEDSYWGVHDALMNTDISSEAELRDTIITHVQNATAFDECYESGEALAEVNQDISQGFSAHVGGTPTFFINDKVIVGPKPLRTFAKIIDEELNK